MTGLLPEAVAPVIYYLVSGYPFLTMVVAKPHKPI